MLHKNGVYGNKIVDFGSIFEGFSESIYVKDISFNIIYVNQAFIKNLKYLNKEQVIGKKSNDLWPEFSSIYHQHDLDTLNNKIYHQIENAYTNQKEKCIVHTKKSKILDKEGNTIGILCRSYEFFHDELYKLGLLINSLMNSSTNIKITTHNFNEKIDEISLPEKECLFYFLHGKSIKSIAKILSLSPRTVEEYIENIKIKWGCHRKEDIFDHAKQQGYLNVVPLTQIKKCLIDTS